MEFNFNQAAGTWDQNTERINRAHAVAEAILRKLNLETNMRGIEIGCGTGLLGFQLLPRLGHLTFADNSGEMLTQVQEKITDANREKISTLQIDISREILPASYDFICSLMAFHHLPGIEKNIAHMYAHLNPGGYFCLADLEQDDGSFHKEQHTFYHGFNRQELCKLFREQGFIHIEEETPFRIYKTSDEEQKAFAVFLITAQKP